MSRLIYWGIGLISAGVTGLIVGIALEIALQEPAYALLMKAASVVFGVGGPLLGWGIARSTRNKGGKP